MILRPRSLSLRLSLFCAGIFGALGAYAPFWSVWLKSRQMDDWQIAVLLSIPSWVRVLGAPLLMSYADRSGRRRRVTLWLSWGAAISFALFHLGHSFVPLFLISCAFGVTFTALVPLSDQSILVAARDHGVEYGRIRLWGSIAFLSVSILGGCVLEVMPIARVFQMILLLLVATAISSHALPAFDSAPAVAKSRPSLSEVVAIPGTVRSLAIYGLLMGSHAGFMAFGTLHWQRHDIRDQTIGLLWGEGVVVEIVFFVFAARIATILGPRRLYLLGALGGVIRWTGVGLTTWLPVLVILQAMHALTFAACHLAAMEFTARTAPRRVSTTALGLYSSVSGLCSASFMVMAGPIFERWEEGVFFTMALPAAVAFGLAWRPLIVPSKEYEPDGG